MDDSYNEIDDWKPGETITSQEKLAKISEALDQTVLIVEHRHYRGGRAPTRIFFDDYGEFLAYLNENARLGDSFRAWPFDLCTDANAVAVGKFPDKQGKVPVQGAY
jgi:hypothetical protein